MTCEAWIMITGISVSNVVALVAGLVHMTSRLTRMETDIAWLKRNIKGCQPTSENPSP